MADGAIVVKARIRLLSADEGGRTLPVYGRYRPNHGFFDNDRSEMMIGQIDFGTVPCHPGETRDVTIEFLDAPELNDLLQNGREWRIQEGDRLIGVGLVIERLKPA